MSRSTAQKTTVTFDVPKPSEDWELPEADETWVIMEEDVPESAWHDATIELLKLILKAWAERERIGALIASNLALRFQRNQWKVGVDPDVAVYIPPPPKGENTESVCLWKLGHAPPRVAIEIVSRSTNKKDYVTGLDHYAKSGTVELWVFDPKGFGPKGDGGPFALQVWRRDEAGFQSIYRGSGPFKSPEMGAWLVVTDDGMRLRLADDREGTHLWLTAAERAEQERESAEQRTRELEGKLSALQAELDRLRGRA